MFREGAPGPGHCRRCGTVGLHHGHSNRSRPWDIGPYGITRCPLTLLPASIRHRIPDTRRTQSVQGRRTSRRVSTGGRRANSLGHVHARRQRGSPPTNRRSCWSDGYDVTKWLLERVGSFPRNQRSILSRRRSTAVGLIARFNGLAQLSQIGDSGGAGEGASRVSGAKVCTTFLRRFAPEAGATRPGRPGSAGAAGPAGPGPSIRGSSPARPSARCNAATAARVRRSWG